MKPKSRHRPAPIAVEDPMQSRGVYRSSPPQSRPQNQPARSSRLGIGEQLFFLFGATLVLFLALWFYFQA
ncbi:hypothetical protein [Fuerstiella marisgermanici]|uniref:Uncharacterized protein n=1 Tax=Fuerstiella marisgermanici TaxID=1891926 RepID=A0A1P8WP69_9PLAN|nr:hypothetical protein [Fuerstiella marisgermanici]APZ95853.1 hypothetical protein Fuma_05516 [Fuerstiella marisgermanici]